MTRSFRPALAIGWALSAVLLLTPAAAAASPVVPPPVVGSDVDPAWYGALQWRNIGPQLGGRSLAVAGSLARPAEYYAGATGGGLWKTTNGGTDWAPVTDGKISSSSVGAVAVCPANPGVVYIGMGETALLGGVIPGDGVYKTTDGGATWRHVGLADTQMIGRIRIDPGNPQVLYASLWYVFRTPWSLNSGGDTSGLFKSTDGGTSWTELTGNPGLPAKPIGKIGVSVSGGNPNRVYALVEAAAGGLYRSDDAGGSWQLVSDDADIRQRAFYPT